MTSSTPRWGGWRRVRWLALLVGQLLVIARPGLAEPTAGSHYERALAEVQAGKLREARQSFEEAYRLSPHYIVLNNLGRVCFDLGDFEAARGYFESYLEQGGNKIAPADRERVEALLAKIRAQPAAREVPPSPAVAPSLQGAEPLSAPPRRASPGPVKGPVPATPPAEPDESGVWKRRLENERRTTAAISLGATGAVMAAAGTAILVWNARRFGDYESQRDALGDPPFTTIRSQEELERSLAYDRALAKNQANLDSVRDFDVVGGSILGVGGALLATGAVLYLTRPGEGTLSVGIGCVELALRF